jgi:medium-chain acyl-[acyl-carrier-protein] hydrolase
MAALVQSLGRAILPHVDMPVAFFGHSLGALICFELARQLRREYGLQPAHLFVSGCRAPQNVEALPRLHASPAHQLSNGVRRLKGKGGPMATTGELLVSMLPTLWADLAVCETFKYVSEPPLACGITAYGGIQDQNVNYESLGAWRQQTTASFALHLFRGSHFFIHTAETRLLEVLSEELHLITGGAGEPQTAARLQGQSALTNP